MRAARTVRATLAALIAIVFASSGVAAEKKADPAREQLRRMGELQRKLEQDKAQLAQDKAALEQDKAALEAQVKTLSAQLAAAKAAVAASKKDLVRVEQDLAESRTRLTAEAADKTALSSKIARLEQELDTVLAVRVKLEANGRQCEQRGQDQLTRIEVCETKNVKLYELNVELADRYRKKGLREALMEREPLTGLKRVEAENLLEEYRHKLEVQRATTPGP